MDAQTSREFNEVDSTRTGEPLMKGRVGATRAPINVMLACMVVLGSSFPLGAAQDRWKRISRGGGTDAIAVDPRNPSIIYSAHWVDGILRRSYDGGNRWQAAGTIPYTDEEGYSLTIDPNDTDTLYIETTAGSCSSCDSAVLKSTDAGDTWQIVQYLGSVDGPIALNPRNSSVIYRAAYYDGVYRSPDGGETWHRLPSSPERGQSIAIDISAVPIVLVGTEAGIYRSTDAGSTWAPANQGLPGDGTTVLVKSLSASSTIAGTVYAATDKGLFLTADGGEKWTRVSAGFDSQDVTHISVDPRDSKVVWASSLGGHLYFTRDGGKAWRDRTVDGALFSGLFDPSVLEVPELVTDLAAGPGSPGTAYVVLREVGVFRTTDGGGSWELAGAHFHGPNAQLILADPEAPGTVYAAQTAAPTYAFSDRELLTVTADDGGTWRLACDGLPAGERQYLSLGWLRDVKISSAGGGTLFATTRKGVYRSVNGGRRWNAVNEGLTQSANAQCLAVDPGDPAHVYVFVSKEGFFESSDAGLHWKLLSSDLASQEIVRIATDASRRDILYSGANAQWHGNPAAVYRSMDDGQTWKEFGETLPNGVFDQITVAPTNPSTVYAIGSFGCFRKRAGEGAWTQIGPRPGLLTVSSIVVDPRNPAVLYAGTTYGGIYRSDNSGNTWTSFSDGLSAKSGSLQVHQIIFDATRDQIMFAATSDGVYERVVDR